MAMGEGFIRHALLTSGLTASILGCTPCYGLSKISVGAPVISAELFVKGVVFKRFDDLNTAQVDYWIEGNGFSIDLTTGVTRFRLDPPSSSYNFASVYLGVEVPIKNTGDSAISFERGSSSFSLTANYFLDPSPPNPPAHPSLSTSRTSMTVAYGANGAHFRSIASFDHKQEVDSAEQLISSWKSPTGTSGATAYIHEASQSGLSVALEAGAFAIAPKEEIIVGFAILASVSRSKYGGVSVIDSSNSGHLNFMVPSGVEIEMNESMGWISAVPEPSVAMLSLCAFPLVFIRRRASRRP